MKKREKRAGGGDDNSIEKQSFSVSPSLDPLGF